MIFNLHPLLGLLPLVLYIVLGFRGVHSLLATLAGVALAAVLSGQTPVEIGSAIAAGAGSFLGQIGLLVMFGTALAEMLKDTGAAPLMVRGIMKRFPLTPAGILIGSMVSIVLLTIAIGSMIAAAAMVGTVAITLAATKKVSPCAMAIAFHTGSVTGLILGPFTPPSVQIMKLSEMSYSSYALSIALPFSALIFVTGAFMALYAQKKYGENGQNLLYPSEEMADTEQKEVTKTASRSAIGFICSIVPLIIYGIIVRGGMAYAMFLIIVAAILTGIFAGYKPLKIMEVFVRGASRMAWFYLMFVLFDPFIKFITDAGAFTAIGNLIQPAIDKGGNALFIMIGGLFGIFGISGAAIAQVEIMDGMFLNTAVAMGVAMPLYYTMLIIGSQITSFAYPGADMMTEMGLARSTHLKSMIVNGWVITGVMIVYLLVRAIIGV